MAPSINGKLPGRRVLSGKGSIRAVSTNFTKAGRRLLSDEGRIRAVSINVI